MKCPNCSYEFQWDIINGERKPSVGEDEFDKVSVNTDHVQYDDHGNIVYREEEINVCPKCGILFRG